MGADKDAIFDNLLLVFAFGLLDQYFNICPSGPSVGILFLFYLICIVQHPGLHGW
jgi:hypothetical protein